MNLATDKTVREFALEIPGATRVFEKMGIDYCCGGNRSLADACAIAGVNSKTCKLELTLAATPQAEAPNFQTATLEELIRPHRAKASQFYST